MNEILKEMLLTGKSFATLTNEQLIAALESTDITSTVFTVLEAEMIKRLT
jgi:hypothetical protein